VEELGDLRPYLVRVLDSLGEVAGTGFLCHPDGYALTCWHVLKSWEDAGRTRGEVLFDEAKVTAEWVGEQSVEAADLAVLRLLKPSEASGPWRYLPVDAHWRVQVSNQLHSFGYPSGPFADAGIPIAPKLQGLTPTQVDGIEVFPLAGFNLDDIDQGYSGAPVVNEVTQQVVGLVHAKHHETQAFIIPLWRLFEVWPELHAFAVDAAKRSESPRLPAQAPPLRVGFVPRPRLLKELRDRLRPGPAGALRIVALHGMAGSGKSIMAAAAAVDQIIGSRFPDGVLWASLGLAPELTSFLAGWIQALEPKTDLRFADPAPAQQHLQTLLSDRAILLVLDDVWEAAHAAALIAGGPRCAVLITTREAAVAHACGVAPEDMLPVGNMTSEEACALLAGGVGRSLPDAVDTVVGEVAASVGFLPHALHLASAQAAAGVPWQEIRDDLQAEIARLETLDLPGADELLDPQLAKQQSLLASIALSIRRLPHERRRQLAWLGIAKHGAEITSAMAAIVWAVDARAARDGLRYLHSRALLETSSGTSYRLHSTIHALALRLVAAPVTASAQDRFGFSGLGMLPSAAHAELVDRYAATRVEERWLSLADDGYIPAHLAWHLEEAERVDELHNLLAETTADSANAWFMVRERLGQPEGYFDDVRRAFRLATGGLRVRYALVLASLRSTADVPPGLVQALIRARQWTVTLGTAYARNIADARARALTLAAVAEVAAEDKKRELLIDAMAAVEGMRDDKDEVISTLAPRLAAAGLADEALSLARRLGGQPRASALAEIVAAVPASERKAIVAEAAEAAAASGPLFRSGAIAAVAPYLDEGQIRKLLADSAEIRGETLREAAVAPLMPRLAEIGFADEALATARRLSGSHARADSLASLAATIPEPGRAEVEREVLSLLPSINDEKWAERLAREVPELPPAARALLVFSLTMRSTLAGIIESLPPDLAPELQQRAITVIDGRKDILEAARAMSILAPRLADEDRISAVRRIAERARNDSQTAARASALAALIDAHPADQRAAIAREALEFAADQIMTDLDDVLGNVGPYLDEAGQLRALDLVAREHANSKASALSALAPSMSPSLLPRAVEIARSIDDEDAALLTSAALAPGLDAGDLAVLLDWAPRVSNEYVRARAVAAILPRLTADLLLVARKVIDGIKNRTALAGVALPALAARLTGHEKDAALERAVAVAGTIDDPAWLVSAFEAFAPQLSATALSTAVATLEAALGNQPEHLAHRVQLLATAALADRALRGSLVARALTLASQPADDEERAGALCALAPVLVDDERSTIATSADGIANTFERASVYAALAATAATPQEARDMATRALKQAEHFVETALSVNQQAEIIGGRVLPYVAERAGADALSLIAGFEDTAFSSHALANIAPRLDAELVPKAIEIARGYPPGDRPAPLLALAAKLTAAPAAALLAQALDAALEIDIDLLHDRILTPVAQELAKLTPSELAPLWRRALDALSDWPRPAALAALHALAPVLLRMETGDGARACFRALRDMRQWWP